MTRNKQTLLLDNDGILLDSCNSLFVVEVFKNKKILPCFPFLESVFHDLFDRLKREEVISFPGVETKHSFLPGYYDYAFKLVEKDGRKLIEWQILDATKVYNEVKIKQQDSHEKEAFPSSKTNH